MKFEYILWYTVNIVHVYTNTYSVFTVHRDNYGDKRMQNIFRAYMD